MEYCAEWAMVAAGRASCLLINNETLARSRDRLHGDVGGSGAFITSSDYHDHLHDDVGDTGRDGIISSPISNELVIRNENVHCYLENFCVTACSDLNFKRNCIMSNRSDSRDSTGFDSATGVVTRDVLLDAATNVTVRIFLPTFAIADGSKLPVVYFVHGGAFFWESALDHLYTKFVRYLSHISAALFISVEYCLAPEYKCNVWYDDAWSGLQYTVGGKDAWINKYGDLKRLFVAGESAGGNIAHNILVRAGTLGAQEVEGGISLNPTFFGEKNSMSEKSMDIVHYQLYWKLMCPSSTLGLSDPIINPLGEGGYSLLLKLPPRIFICTRGDDPLRGREDLYRKAVKKTGREVSFIKSPRKGHAYFVTAQSSEQALELFSKIVKFIHTKGSTGCFLVS